MAAKYIVIKEVAPQEDARLWGAGEVVTGLGWKTIAHIQWYETEDEARADMNRRQYPS